MRKRQAVPSIGRASRGRCHVGEALDEGRGGCVEPGVHAGGQEGVGLDEALEVRVAGAEQAGDAGVTLGEGAGGAAEVLELALVEIEVVHGF